MEEALLRIAEMSKRLEEGNTKRSVPFKNISMIKKAKRKFDHAKKDDPELTMSKSVFL